METQCHREHYQLQLSAMLLSLLVTACTTAATTSASVQPPGSTRVTLLQGTRAAAIPRALSQAAPRAGLEDCGFAWGDLGEPWPKGRLTILALEESSRSTKAAGQPTITGMLVCGKAIEALLKHPRLHQIVMLEWRGGQLLASHPSGPGRTAVNLEELERRPEESGKRTYAVFGVHPSDKTTAAELWPTLVRLPRTVIFAIWMIGVDNQRH